MQKKIRPITVEVLDDTHEHFGTWRRNFRFKPFFSNDKISIETGLGTNAHLSQVIIGSDAVSIVVNRFIQTLNTFVSDTTLLVWFQL